MAISIKHAFTSAKADGTDATLVQPSNWNAEHNITLAAGKVLGRDSSGAGAVQELPISVDGSGNVSLSSASSYCPQISMFNSTADGTASFLILAKGRASNTTSQNGDTFGTLVFQGRDTSNNLANAAAVYGVQDAASGASSVPGALVFCSGGFVERMRVDSGGNVLVGVGAQYGSAKLSVAGSVIATSGWAGTNSSAGKLGGVVQSFACERNGSGSVGGYLAFGNGVTGSQGLRMPYAGKLLAATLHGTAINGTVTLDAAINGTANTSFRLTATGSTTDVGVTQDWQSSPLSFSANDKLGFYQTAVPTGATGYNVSFYVIFD